MSAIDTTFHWVRNPTILNSLSTTYVSKRGSDVNGNGTAQNPYASLAKATSVATANTNIMLDDGEWNEARTANNRGFYWWGNGKTIVKNYDTDYTEYFHYLSLLSPFHTGCRTGKTFFECVLFKPFFGAGGGPVLIQAKHCLIYQYAIGGYGISGGSVFTNCVLVNIPYNTSARDYIVKFYNCVFCKTNKTISGAFQGYGDYNNFTNYSFTLPHDNSHSVFDSNTGQTNADYFNFLCSSFVSNSEITFEELLQCDFTAKEGSANVGIGEKGITIGLNEGFTMYADNSANDVFKESNGATLRNIAWDSTLNGYTLVQKERICQGATSNTIILDSSASAVDDYYNNLFIGIVGGDGYGELFLITDYDGATKTATIDGTWNTTPTTNSIYTISGTILSAIKDLGKVIKIKRNWTFADNFTALQDGQWAEFLTHVETNGKQFPASCYSYEYSTDGVNFIQGQTADDLVSATNGENKVTDNIYGDCSPNYDESTAKNLVLRYIRVRVHIGFNI